MNHIVKWAGKVHGFKIGLEHSGLAQSLKKLTYSQQIEDLLIGFWSALESGKKNTQRQ